MSEQELKEQIAALQRQITTMSQYLGAVCEEVLQLQARVHSPDCTTVIIENFVGWALLTFRENPDF